MVLFSASYSHKPPIVIDWLSSQKAIVLPSGDQSIDRTRFRLPGTPTKSASFSGSPPAGSIAHSDGIVSSVRFGWRAKVSRPSGCHAGARSTGAVLGESPAGKML